MVFSGIRDGIKKDFKELKDKVQKIDMGEVKEKVSKDITGLKNKVKNIDMSEVKEKVQKDFSTLKDKVTKMVISLKKGQTISLTKEAPSMTKMLIGLGWDMNSGNGQDCDLDASVILVTKNGKVRNDNDFIFYGKLKSDCGAIVHMGDNKTGSGAGDNEQISIEVGKLDSDIDKLVILASIHNAQVRKQHFGMVSNAYIRIVNAETEQEIIKYNLTDEYSTETALVFAEIYRYKNEWKVKAIGQGFNDGLKGIGRSYGLSLSDDE